MSEEAKVESTIEVDKKEKMKENMNKVWKAVKVALGVVVVAGVTYGICKAIGSVSKSASLVGATMGMSSLADQNHHANQMNPNSKAYKDRMDNHANQMNPNNWRYQGK